MHKVYMLLVLALGWLAQAQAQENTPASAQTDTDKPSRQLSHEVGIAASSLIQTLFTDNALSTPYFLTYKLSIDRLAIRSALGGRYQQNLNLAPDLNVNTSQIAWDLDARLGLEWQTELSKRWRVSLGVDGLLTWEEARAVQEAGGTQLESSRQTLIAGAGPVVGCWLNLNQRLSIYAESALYFTSGTNTQSRIGGNNPGPDPIITQSEVSGLNFLLPGTFFLVYRF